MARIVFAWEMGANYGHISGFAPVASVLLDRGHEIVAVVQSAHDARHFFDRRVAVLQAPLRRKLGAAKDRPQQVTYADLIKPLGYEDPVELATLLRVWRSTFEVTRPDLVLFDSAPTAQLAARSFDFVKLTIGSAFGVPPRTAPLPLLFKEMKVPFPEHEKRERAVVDVVNAALAEFGLARIAALREALGADADLLRGYPELDHYGYGSRKEGEWFGAGFSLDSGVEVEWPPGDGAKIFLYLRPPVRAELLLKQLAPLGYRMIAVMPNLVQPTGKPPSNLRMLKDPARLRSLVESADLAICHSAVGTGAAFLLGGVPILAIPTNAEQAMIAARVEEQGFGLSVRDTASTDYKTPVRRLLSEPSFRQKAREFARKYPETSEERTERLCDRVESALAERRARSAAAAS